MPEVLNTMIEFVSTVILDLECLYQYALANDKAINFCYEIPLVINSIGLNSFKKKKKSYPVEHRLIKIS